MGAADLSDPAYQIGAGCLVDQLVGQYMAHICGLGYLVKPAHVRKALRSVYKYNRRKNFHNHFNNMRSYVLGDESALLMCAYPRGNRPRQPFPYATEVMTGFEYTAAVGMLYEGQLNAGLSMHPGRTRSLRRPQAQPLRRGRMRAPLCPRHGGLGGGVGLDRLLLFRGG